MRKAGAHEATKASPRHSRRGPRPSPKSYKPHADKSMPRKTEGPRIVTLDIETAPLEVYCWGIWEQNIDLGMLQKDWTILAFCAKWLDKKTPEYHDTGGRGVDKVRDDRELLAAVWKVLDEADIVITQNGISFDIKKINARLLAHGFPPYSPVKMIDTKLEAGKKFAFTSNKLAWMSSQYTDTPKSSHKKFPGFSLWEGCLRDDPAAWAEMKKYNIRDVEATERLYLKMRPWISNHPNVAAFAEATEIPTCPKCGSDKVQRRGHARSQVGTYNRYQCQNCGGWSKSRHVLGLVDSRRGLLGN